MSFITNVTDFPLKSPTTELLFYESPISTLLYEIRTSEAAYRDQLSKLLGCCSPLKRQAANGFTNSVRKLIAYHTDLVRSLDHSDEVESIENFIRWVKNAIPVYQNYIQNYQLDVNSLNTEVQLKKAPFVRINQLSKFFNKIVDINETHPEFQIDFDCLVLKNLMKLMEMARDKNEMENLRIDLNTLLFDKVHSLNLDFYKTVGYFQLDQCIKRDYFKFDLIHPRCIHTDYLVEVFQLSDNTIAICSVEAVGRSLMFPALKALDFNIVQNDLDVIHLKNDDDVELKFTCPDRSQLSYWNNVVGNLFASDHVHESINQFTQRHHKLQELKNQRVGLGLDMKDTNAGSTIGSPIGSSLRKSSPMIAKHSSLRVDPSPTRALSQISSNLANIDHYFNHDVDLQKLNSYTDSEDEAKVKRNNSISPRLNTVPKSNTQESVVDPENYSAEVVSIGTPSPTLPLNIKKSGGTTKLKLEELNSSTVSLPNLQQSKPSLNINEKISGSSIDLSRFDNIKPNLKVKKRRSIFNIFSKKSNDEPEFEIVTKSSTPSTSIPTISNTPSSESTSTESNETITKPKTSMASLQKNVKKLTITTNTKPSTSSTSSKNESPLPSPFGRSTNKQRQLSPLEEIALANSAVCRVLKNNTIVSQWSQSQWRSIGTEYQHTVKFLSTPHGRVMVLYGEDNSPIPDLMVPTEGASVSKGSSLDIQIKCHESIESKRLIMLNIRTKDVYTLKLITSEFENKQGEISASNSDVFSAPSNSTSMSSVSVNEIQDLGKPSVYKTENSGSNSSLHTKTLLLKSDVKIKLHQMDVDEEWRPVALGKFSISSNLGNPEYSKFEISCVNKLRVETIVKNSNCSRIGRSGIKFNAIDDEGDEQNYLIEYRNSKECVEIYEMLI